MIDKYIIYAVVLIALFCGGFINGCSYQKSKQEQVIRTKEHQYQDAADQIRKQKDEQINAINSQLVDAISQLRERPSRAKQANTGQAVSGCTGAQLYAEDAELVIREAARADIIREALKSCYSQYDALGK